MTKPKVVMNIPGCIEVRNSAGVQAVLLSRAQHIAGRATASGCPCTADVRPGATRAHARVATSGPKAAASNAKHNTLLKSLDAGRG